MSGQGKGSLEKKIKKIKIFSKYHLLLSRCCAIIFSSEYASLAQLAEHLTLNQGVQGSNP